MPQKTDEFHPAAKTLGLHEYMARSCLILAPACLLGCVWHTFRSTGKLRDGRRLQRERKPKHVLALQRFLAKSSGFVSGKAENATLDSLGLALASPTHPHRQVY